MSKGRKPKPTYLKVLSGNAGKRPLNRDEPNPVPDVPECPEILSANAKEEWARIAPRLAALGLLTQIDRGALAGYCFHWGVWEVAMEHVKEEGPVVYAKTGFPLVNPWLAVANKSMAEMRAFLAEFGMSPSSRTRVRTTRRQSGRSDDERFFS